MRRLKFSSFTGHFFEQHRKQAAIRNGGAVPFSRSHISLARERFLVAGICEFRTIPCERRFAKSPGLIERIGGQASFTQRSIGLIQKIVQIPRSIERRSPFQFWRGQLRLPCPEIGSAEVRASVEEC